jgi:hypothetical protein
VSLIWLAVPAIGWAGILVGIVPQKGYYKSLADRIMRGKLRDDRNALQIMLNYMVNKPDDWSISAKQASYPKEGAKQIMLQYDDDKNYWTYAINSSGERFRKLDGHFGAQFAAYIAKETDRRQSMSLMRTFDPEFDGVLRLK